MSTQKTFASYLSRHLQPEISPKCHLAFCVTRMKTVTSILDIALGLKNLHDFDIIHGDIRASNVLCSEGHCYLTDFGIAKMSEISTLSSFARMVHNGWAAPELDEQSRSKESDIFSFACTIYEMFTRQPPYGENSNADDRSKPPARIGLLMREEWNKLWEILVVCWSTNPLDRPTATELEASLHEIFQPLSESEDGSCQ